MSVSTGEREMALAGTKRCGGSRAGGGDGGECGQRAAAA
jgi:hypothetical protein